ncbi:hypothetical protein HELRODRAFT_168529 [Helobdella robusta]|uniref:Uncharacterized protein n=1 Tax=Helobdella robusta TaxID=6412 RepID=T1F0P1_HELRO|nr:hypothetical protein HELRODRAFT_168529 [Helobdella robusta]ESO09532.1 hypothetical protein HELRODRAFT_168529 [Helobdella robusta]
MIPKAGGRRRSIAILTTLHGSRKPLLHHGFTSNISIEIEPDSPNALHDGSGSKFPYSLGSHSRRSSAVSDSSAYTSRSNSFRTDSKPAAADRLQLNNSQILSTNSTIKPDVKTQNNDFDSSKNRRHSEYGRFLSPDVPSFSRAGSVRSRDSGELNVGSSCLEEDRVLTEEDGEEEEEESEANDESEKKTEGERSPVQTVGRRRAVNTSDLRSCALVQSKLKSHRNSWKSIDGTPLHANRGFLEGLTVGGGWNKELQSIKALSD